MEILGYISIVIVGLTLGLIGGGGSILTVPILVYLFSFNATISTAYSLFLVGLVSVFGFWKYMQKSLVDIKTGLIFALPSFLGVFLTRTFVIPEIPSQLLTIAGFDLTKDRLIMLVFAFVMLVASTAMIRKKESQEESPKAKISEFQRYLLIAAEGLIVGGVTGFVGAGGGFLIVPALVLLTGLDMKKAIGTSLMIISIKSLFGFSGDVVAGTPIEWLFLLKLSAFALVGMQFGFMLSHKVKGETLKPAFGWFVLIMGVFILGSQFVG